MTVTSSAKQSITLDSADYTHAAHWPLQSHEDNPVPAAGQVACYSKQALLSHCPSSLSALDQLTHICWQRYVSCFSTEQPKCHWPSNNPIWHLFMVDGCCLILKVSGQWAGPPCRLLISSLAFFCRCMLPVSTPNRQHRPSDWHLLAEHHPTGLLRMCKAILQVNSGSWHEGHGEHQHVGVGWVWWKQSWGCVITFYDYISD